jgi:hypothetical protein
MGMGVGYIPLSAYESYFNIFGIDDIEERDEIIRIITKVDSYYLKKQNKPTSKNTNKENKIPGKK